MAIASSTPNCARTLSLALLTIAVAGTQAVAQQPAPSRPAIANPASQNCIDKGGTLSIEKNGKGDEYGICIFPDNLQCEEWAMMRGDCRVGGVKVTGYATPAGRYCAITGGTYAVSVSAQHKSERGTCTFVGRRCDAEAYFKGACSRSSAGQPKATAARAAGAPKIIRAHFACSSGKTIEATFVNGVRSSAKLVLSDGRALTLPQARSASGARYANKDESVVFWNKGDTAFIEEAGKTTYEGCLARSW